MSSKEWMYLTHSGCCDNYCLLINRQSRKTSSSGQPLRESQWHKWLFQAGRVRKDVTDVQHQCVTCHTQLGVSVWSPYWETRAHFGTQSSTMHSVTNVWVSEKKIEYVSSNISEKKKKFKGKYTLTLKTSN